MILALLLAALPALHAEGGAAHASQDAAPTFDELAALWEREEHDWLARLSEARREGRYRIVLAERPTPAFVARFEAWAARGEGRAELWLLTNVQDLELPEDEVRARKARAFERLRAAPEHPWLGALVPVIARERRWVGEAELLGFLEDVWRRNASADVRAQAGFMLARRLESHGEAADRRRALEVYDLVARAAPSSVIGKDALRRAADLSAEAGAAGEDAGVTLTGRVAAAPGTPLGDEAPELDPELVARCCAGTARAVPAPEQGADRALAGAVVEVLVPDAAAPEGAETALALAGCRLVPRVVAAPAGATLVVRNEDAGCFALRSDARANEVPAVEVASGAPVRVELAGPEVFSVRSDALPWTRAWVWVARSPFVAVTDADGLFRISGLPAGEYDVRVWHEHAGELSARVALEGARVDAPFVLGEGR